MADGAQPFLFYLSSSAMLALVSWCVLFRAGMDAEEAIEVIKTARPDLKRIVKVHEVSQPEISNGPFTVFAGLGIGGFLPLCVCLYFLFRVTTAVKLLVVFSFLS